MAPQPKCHSHDSSEQIAAWWAAASLSCFCWKDSHYNRDRQKNNGTAQPATASSRITFCIVPPRVFSGALARDLVLLTPSANTLLHRRFYCVAVMNISHRKAQLLQPERKICLFQGRGHTFVTCKKKQKNTSLTRRLCSSLQNPVAVSLKNIFSA